jgi:hypothetical protein
MPNEIRGPEWFRQQDWPELRKSGREHFVWRHRILPYGVPMGLAAVAWWFDRFGLGARDILTRQGISLTYSVMGVDLLVTYVLARIEWVQREEKFADKGRPK